MAAKTTTPAPPMSDATVQAKTGRNWDEWFRLLDDAGAARLDHKGIVATLDGLGGASAWWQQGIAVAYERARGLRAMHQMPDGFAAQVSKTISATPDALFARFDSPKKRRALLGGDHLKLSSSTPGKVIHAAWEDTRGRVDIQFAATPAGRTRVVIAHRKLADAEEMVRFKAYWSGVLARLAGAAD